MNRSVLLPKSRVIGISRFTAGSIAPVSITAALPAPPAPAEPSMLCDLDTRCTTPLLLSEALRAQLPAADQRNFSTSES